MSKKGLSGQELFKEYYGESIISALSKENKKIARFAPENKKIIQKLWREAGLETKELFFYPNAFIWPEEAQEGQELPGVKEGLLYIQNASSLLPVLALSPQEQDTILDACAAPGGKTLMISETTKNISLTVNDLSYQRIKRLLNTFQEHNQKEPIYHTQNAATLFKRYPEHFDRILLDAPCSSEKHIWHSQKHLDQWKPGRIKQLKQRQISLINGLFLALKPGGTLVYSTCAINSQENQEVIKKFLKKHQEQAQIIDYPQHLPGHQNDSPYGFIDITKEKNDNLDPMFIAIIKKNEL